MSAVLPTRRAVIASGGGLVLAFWLPGCAKLPPRDFTIQLGGAPSKAPEHDLNAYVRIAESGEVTLRMGASEMGQGVYTSLPMILAEELDVDWTSVRVESSATDRSYAHDNVDYPGSTQITGGSLSVRGYWTALREAGAAARAMIVEAAAQSWGVHPDDCSTAKGQVRCGEQVASYASLAAAAGALSPPRHPRLKDPATFSILGTSPPRLDIPSKVDGSAQFGMDLQLDGMLHASVRNCPHHGGTLEGFDDAEARKVAGVVDVLRVEGVEAVAVLANSTWVARQGAAALSIRWDAGEGKGLDTAKVREVLLASLDEGRKVWGHGKLGATTLEALYEVPYLDHAPIEPVCAVAWVQADRVDLWAPTQAQEIVRARAASIAKLPVSQSFVHTTFLGGGFGRKGFTDFTDHALQLSVQTGHPVKVTYSREECFAHGYYRPATLCRFRAALGSDGMVSDYSAQMASQNILQQYVPEFLLGLSTLTHTITGGVSDLPYSVPNAQVDYKRVELPIPVGWWRSVHGSHNGFFVESFIDECALAAGQDPITYRRKLLANNPRFLQCLELAVKHAGEVPAGQHRGVAIFECFGSIVAEVADVSVTGGQLKVHRVTAAVDAGMIVHPDTIHAQIESAVGMGLSMMLGEGLTVKEGVVQETNFHQYPLLTMAQMPAVDVHIVPSTEPPGGIGEVGLPPLPGAVCNAIFAATGKRIRRLPLGDQLRT